MLERVTACIKAGARDSLKCAQQQSPRASRRRLHQTFWTHGAGDLDLLPPYASFPTPPKDLTLGHDDTPRARGRDQTTEPYHLATDGIFLDFLYPPQALAYLHRTGRQQSEYWEKRNARRLPDGFVQASRGFSSKSRSQSAMKDDGMKPQADGVMRRGNGYEPPVNDTLLGDVEGESDRNARLRRGQFRTDKVTLAHTLLEEVGAGRPAETGKEGSDAEAYTREEEVDADFANSPSDLAEESLYSSSSHRDAMAAPAPDDILHSVHDHGERLRHLRLIMGMKRGAITTAHIRQAWRLYLSLPNEDKRDARLKEKLLVWLSDREHELADAHIISLYWSITVEARTLPTYQIVARSFIRRREEAMLHALHKEALLNISNAQQVTLQLFEDSLKSRDWRMAQRVVLDHDSTFPAEGRHRHIELFWAKVQAIQNLIDLTSPLVKEMPHGISRGGNVKQSRYLHVRLSKEAIQQATDELFVRRLSDRRREKIFKLLGFIKDTDGEARLFFNTLLTRLLPLLGKHYHEKRGSGTAALREDAHGIISYLYWNYRESKAAKLHPDLLLIWLKHLTKRMDTTNTERRSERNVTANMVIADWQLWHAQLSIEAIHSLIKYSARAGAVDALARWTSYLARRYPAYQEQQKVFWTQIYVHASLSDLSAAKKAFQDVRRSARAHGVRPDLRCWNVLLLAHQKADDLKGAIDTFTELIQTTDLTPDLASFGPFFDMLSRRGDVDAMEDLLRQYDVLTQEKRRVSFVNMQLRALTYLDDLPRAELLLAETLSKVRRGEVIGSMTDCFNTMLSKYASERDMNAVTITYRRMKQWNIHRNATTYQHLMQALANFRRTSAAWAILNSVMKDDGFEATAAHYIVAMSGFINQGEPEKAIMAHNHMLAANVRQSVGTKAALTKANAFIERSAQNRARVSGAEPSDPLTNALAGLQETVDSIQARDITNTGSFTPQDTFSPVMWLLGGERQMEAVQQLFQNSKEVAEKHGQSPWPTLRLSAALMNAMYHAKEYSQVEAYWRVAKNQADDITPLTVIPDFVALREASQTKKLAEPKEVQNSIEPAPDDRAEIGFVTRDKSTVAHIQTGQAESTSLHLGPRPAPARRHVLTRPFRIYLAALAAQDRLPDAIKEATRLLTQGYTFDNITWNRLIIYIAGSDPPLALLSFTLMERYMIRNFPGWVTRDKARKYRPRKSAKAFGLQYIRARYLAKGELMPQYRTFIWLAKALLEVQRREAIGWKGDNAGNEIDPALQRFVGTVKQIREKAPTTLKYVQLMPRIDDKWQGRLLRGIGWKFPPGSNRLRVVGDATLEASDVVEVKLSTLARETGPTSEADANVAANVDDEGIGRNREVPASGVDVQAGLGAAHSSKDATDNLADDAGVVIDDEVKVKLDPK